MNLIEALKVNGKARRVHWAKGAFTYFNGGLYTKSAPKDSIYWESISSIDFFSDDWEPVREQKKWEGRGLIGIPKIPDDAKVTIEWEE